MINAQTPAVPLSAGKSAGFRSTSACPAQDLFQAVLQGRLVMHLQRKGTLPAGLQPREGLPFPPRGGGRGAPAGDFTARRPGQTGTGQAGSAERRLPPERLPEVAALLLQAGLPWERLQALFCDPKVQEQGLSLKDLQQAWPDGRADESTAAQVLTGFPPSPPPALAGLLPLIEQSPGGVLPVPPSRQPEFAALLGEAGFSPLQVKSLLASPQVQERGLTVEALRKAWAKTVESSPAAASQSPESQDIGPVTAQAGYQRLWDRLRLPPESMPDVRLALQQLGATPEALAGLEEHLTPQGLPVGQVWQVLKECLNQPPAGTSAGGPTDPAASPPAEEVARWRHVLLQAGFRPEAVDGLLGLQPPASTSELKARLAALAPAAPPPESREDPKPVYLPEDLRLRSLWWKNQGRTEPDFGNPGDGWDRNPKTEDSFSPPNPVPDRPEAFSNLTASVPAAAFLPDEGAKDRNFWPLGPEVRQAFWSQVEAGILGHLRPGESRLSLVLDPPQLGQIELRLNLKGEELAVTAFISRSEVAHLAGTGVEQLAQALSQHGLLLSQFRVQAPEGLPGLLPPFSSAGTSSGRRGGLAVDGESPQRRRAAHRVDRFA